MGLVYGGGGGSGRYWNGPDPVPAPAPGPAPAPALPAAPTPIDPKELAASLYDKKIPLALAGRIEVGGRIIEGPVESIIDNELCLSFIVGYYIPVNYWSDTRTVTELYFRGKRAWTLSGGAELSGLNVGGATSGTEQRVRFTTGLLTQAADAWSIGRYGAGSAVAYVPLVTGTFENIRLAQFNNLAPFTSVTVEDTCYGDPGDLIAWSDALAALARFDGRTTAEFETVDVTGGEPGFILGDSITFTDFLAGMRKLKPHWNILTKDKLYVVEKGIFSLDLTVERAKVLRKGAEPIVIHRADALDRPRRKKVNFIDVDRDYEPNNAVAEEDLEPVASTDAFDEDDFNVPLASTPSSMIPQVNFALYSEIMARETSEYTGTKCYLGIEPGDTQKIVTDERDYYHRATEVVRKPDYTVEVKSEGFLTCSIESSAAAVMCAHAENFTASSHTFTDIGFGAENANRVLALGVNLRMAATGQTITGITINGVAATRAAVASNPDQGLISAVWFAEVASGVVGDVVITASGNFFDAEIGVYRLITSDSTVTDSAATDATTAAPVSISIDLPASGFVIAVAATRQGADFPWTGAASDCSVANIGGLTGQRAPASYSADSVTGHSISIDPSSVDRVTLCAAAWSLG